MHLAFMRQQNSASLLLNYPWRDISVVLVHLQKVHDQRSYIRTGLAELEAHYDEDDEEVPRYRQAASRLAAALLVHTSLSSACKVLVEALEILDSLRNRRGASQDFPEIQFSRLDPSKWVTMKDEWKICCEGASLILRNLRSIDDSIWQALLGLKRWGSLLFPTEGPGLDELFDLDNSTTKGTRELLHKVFGSIMISEGELRRLKRF